MRILFFFLNLFISYSLKAPLHGFAFWFDAAFEGPAVYPSEQHLQLPLMGPTDKISQVLCHKKQETGSDEEIMLSTAPGKPPTHWKQVPPLRDLFTPI